MQQRTPAEPPAPATVAAWDVDALPGPFGVSVRNADLATAGMSEVSRLMRLLAEHHVVLIVDQKLTNADYLAFGRCWGTPITFFNPSHRDEDDPELIVIENSATTPEEKRDTALHWHSDSSYDPVVASVTMLLAREAPTRGGETLFADTAAAWSALPVAMQDAALGRVVLHGIGHPRLMLEGESRGGVPTDRNAPHVQTRDAVRHPLVIDHPVTGRRALYAMSGSAFAVEGMTEEDGVEFLLRYKRFATQPQFVQAVKARAGDVLIWDNFAVMHAATPGTYSDSPGERRRLLRISTRDVAPWREAVLARSEQPAGGTLRRWTGSTT